MQEEIEEYEKYLLDFVMVKKPTMPNFNVQAYTDIEYLEAIKEVMFDYNKINDDYLYIRYLKGE